VAIVVAGRDSEKLGTLEAVRGRVYFGRRVPPPDFPLRANSIYPFWGTSLRISDFKLPRMLIKRKILVAFLAVFALLGPAAGAQAGSLSGSETSLVQTINSVRTSRGLAPLRVDFRLVRAARGHSADMLRRQYFAHGSVSRRARAAGARGPVFGENLAWAAGLTAQWVVDKWLASPSHRAVMLRPGFRRVGIGIVFGTFAGRGGAGVVTADFAGT
jgi:hypothetical protein